MSTHKQLMNLLRTLGYQDVDGGVCRGVTVRWIEDALAGERSRFEQCLEKISTHDNLVLELKKAQSKKGKNLTSEDESLLDILAFCDSLMLYQMPMYCTEYFREPAPLRQQDIPKISQVASSTTLEAHGGLSTIYATSTFYKQKELIKYLDRLAFVLEGSPGSIPESFGMIFSTAQHAIGLTYTQGQGWHLMDINTYPAVFYKDNTSSVTCRMFDSFQVSTDTDLVFTISIHTIADNPQLDILRERLAQFKGRHAWTAKRLKQAQSVFLARNLVVCDDVDTILALSQRGYDVNQSTSEDLWTPLHYAAASGNDNSVRALLDAGADPEIADCHQMSPMHIAAMYGNLGVVKVLVEHGYDVNHVGTHQWTSLDFATLRGQVHIVDDLLHRNAKKDNIRLVMLAIHSDNPELVRIFIQHQMHLDCINDTVFTQTAQYGQAPFLEALFKHNIPFHGGMLRQKEIVERAISDDYPRILDVLQRYGWDIGAYNIHINLKLVQQSQVAVLLELIKAGIDVNEVIQCTEDELCMSIEKSNPQERADIKCAIRKMKTKDAIFIKPSEFALILENYELSHMLTTAKEIKALYNQIELFKAYGDTRLDVQERNAVLNLAHDFADIVNRYFVARYKIGNDEECANIRQEFKAAIAKGKASGYAANWQTFLINIALAASVLGLLFMAARYVRTGNAFFACVYSDAWKKVDAIESALRPHL